MSGGLPEDLAGLLRALAGASEPEEPSDPVPGKLRALHVSERLREQSRRTWFTDPAAAVEYAESAVALAGLLDAEHYGAGITGEEQALAWAFLGNALRISSDLRRAEEALATAEEIYGRLGDDAYTEAEIQSFKASLRNSQGRYQEASDLLDSALEVYQAAGDTHREGRTLVEKAIALSYAGKQAQALELVREALDRIDPDEEPGLLLAARHNLIGYLNELGRREEALEELGKAQALFQDLGAGTQLVRLCWLEGRILRDLDRLEEAERALSRARESFIRQGTAFDAALVALDMAILYLRNGKHQDIKSLAAEMVPIFESRDVREEALAAFLLFRQAAEAETLTLGLIREVAGSLERMGREAEVW